jgi:two-component system heavy metal sensor histidine kinase CusS
VVLRPLQFIRATAQRISSDNLSERIPLPAHEDELTDLARLLNQMFERLEASFAQIKRFAAEASHELKTPLSLIRLHAEKMLEDPTLPPQGFEAVLVQLEQVARLNQIIEEMLFLSRAEAGALRLSLLCASPDDMLRRFEQDAQALAEHNERTFRLQVIAAPQVLFEERWLRHVWLNLLSNALAATPQGGLITMTSALRDGQWQVVMEDEGAGLTGDELARMFERFVQFGPAEQRAAGSGLGLAISRSIVLLHGGSITAENRPDRSGLRITVSLPSAPAEAEAAARL